MIKVNNGWQTRSIDEVENLASQAASPTSSNSFAHGRQDSSASPHLPSFSSQPLPQTWTFESNWKKPPRAQSSASPPSTTPPSASNSLAPPAPIHASAARLDAHRNSRTRHAPSHLSHSHNLSPGAPHTPGQPSPMQTSSAQRSLPTPVADPILFSPHQNAREQEAIESLIFMGSPGNTGNLGNAFSPPMVPPQRNSASHHGHQRTALPSSRLSSSQEAAASPARKSLPSGRPQNAARRIGLAKSSGRDVQIATDNLYSSPRGHGASRRKINGGQPSRPTIPISSGLNVSNQPRPEIEDEDIERMLDRAAGGDSSDSEGEIQLPVRAPRTGAIGA